MMAARAAVSDDRREVLTALQVIARQHEVASWLARCEPKERAA
jgi:hypothetical protein